MASFRGLSFNERGESGTAFPVFGSVAQSTVLRPARGSRIIIQSSGQKEARLALAISGTGAQITSLLGAVDTVGTLSYSGGTRQAYLESVTEPRRVGTGDYFLASLSFLGL